MTEPSFEDLVAPYRGELRAHCYRMLGSIQDAEDALQNALLGAWQGFGGFEGRSSVRTWLYRITTNACLRFRERRRVTSVEHGPAWQEVEDLGAPLTEIAWVEPCPDPQVRHDQLASVELAYVAALQLLPATQRAVLILREVLTFSAAEVAEQLDMTVPAVNSALQRARQSLRAGGLSQQDELAALGEHGQRRLVDAFVDAWARADVDALTGLLVEDARLTMPPLAAWFDGRDSIRRFVAESMFRTPWRLVPVRANGQLAFACYQGPEFRLGAVNVVSVRDGRVAAIDAFLDPTLHARFGLPPVFRATTP
ncbi:RNA polymerase subunit sigma-70 [Kutzneria buriramensis]|uniref:RNA polymerase sigma-70 factor (ECF subfamily) n=1 Tax=Kutzneria buriramensis TaxID=1045776 RepID=A0A3E0I682_9PSEU|nr:RNA polymerase subunit sigma-70 [Kutzneria buriramensis]REH54264.1 RNA polymerase sigma-70 factor (ECF subfamily) [Kutzneria buriramensis]